MASALLPVGKTYFAAETDEKKLGKLLREKVDRFERYIRESGLYMLWAAMHRHYHGIDRDGFSSHEIENKGREGELAVFNQNFIRELITHYRTLAQGQRASLEPLATDEDYESEVQKIRAKGILEDADRKHRLEELRNEAIEYAAVYGVGYMRQKWNSYKGAVAAPGDLDSIIGANGPEAAGQSPRLPEEGSATGLNEDQTGVLEHRLAPHDETVDSAIMSAQGMPPPAPEEPQEDLLEGCLEADVFLPTDVVIDIARRNANHDWWLLRTYLNRWDVAAQHPAMKDKILRISDPDPLRPQSIDLRFEAFNANLLNLRTQEEDLIECWEFWHKRTPACPNGRKAYMLSDGTVLESGDLDQEEVTIRYVAPGRILNTPFFYTPGFDLLSPQEALNMLQSIAITNQRAHGVGIILMPQGSNLVPEEITTGLAVCEYIGGLGKPEAMNFTSTPAEVFGNMDRIEDGMQKTSGINGTIRGDPEANLKSGSALVFVQSQAVQYATSFQNAIVRFYEMSATDTIKIYQKFMPDEMIFEILGEQDAFDVLSIGREQINRIVRIRIEVVNPMMNTLAGRQQITEGMIKMYGPTVISPGGYLRMLLTGQYAPESRSQERKVSGAKKMCQLLAQGIGLAPPPFVLTPPMPECMACHGSGQVGGKNGCDACQQPVLDPMTGQPMPNPKFDPTVKYVRPLATDDHRFMVEQACTVTFSPASRSNEPVVKAVLSVVRAHKELLQELTMTDPGMLELTGQMPLQSAMMGMMGGMPMPGGPEASGGPPGVDGPPGLPPGDNAPPGPMGAPKMPQMPRSPMNGKRPDEPNLIGQQM